MGVCASPHLEHKLCFPSPLLLTPPSPALPSGLASKRKLRGELDPCLNADLTQGPLPESSNGLGIYQRRRGINHD